MPRACSICTSPNRNVIDTALSEGVAIETVAERVNISKSAIGRHKLNCLAPKLAAAARLVAPASESRNEVIRAQQIAGGQATPTAAEAVSYVGLVATLSRSLARLEAAADVAASDKAIAALSAVSGQLHKAIEVSARLAGLNKGPDEGADSAPRYSLTIQFSERVATMHGGAPARIVDVGTTDDETGADVGAAAPVLSRPPMNVPDFGAAPDAEAGHQFTLQIQASSATAA